ncbi:MAG: magnesium transporter CorA family protein [Dehalococcoidales bacterium]|nr:magnesium transporter CorA family protein [Dehalococcoidales bacterium]
MAKLLNWNMKPGKKGEIPNENSPETPLSLETVTWEGLTWVNIEAATEREIDWLAKKYNFHQLALDDCLSRKQISKLDVYPGYLFFVFHYPLYHKETRIATKQQWSAFIGENFLVTINTLDIRTIGALFRDCIANEDTRQEYMQQGPGFLLYRILDRSIDAYFPVLDKILSLMEDLEDAVFDEDVEVAKELSILRRDIITQRAVMFPTRKLFTEMENKLKRFSKTDVTAYYNDLMDHIDRICSTLDECQEMIEVYKDTDYVLATNRLNRVVRILNIIATITLPFVAISSIFGMNVFAPGGIEQGDLTAFIILIIVMAASAGFMLFFFHRKRWI